MTQLSSTGEIGSFRDVDQFQPAKTQFACGFFSGAILKAMGEPGAQPTQSVTQMIAEAESWYAQDDGSNSISNTDGMSLAQEYDMIVNKMGMHYQAIAPSAQAVAAWLRDGYPVMLTITETSVYDLYLPGNPYTAWRPSGNHIFVVTGVTSRNNFLVRDPANCTSLTDPKSLRPGPRLYDAGRLQILAATVVVPPWKPRPISSTAPNPAESAVAGWFVDISQYQPTTIDWPAYRAWATKNGGVARLSIRASEGTGVVDSHYQGYRQGAEQNGVKLIHYHYADPDLNSAQAEADYFRQVVGSTIGPDDQLMLDYEKNVPQATADWALAWLERTEQNYGRTPLIYASPSFIQAHLQDSRLSRFGLVLADWTYDPAKRPAIPAPWSSLVAWQYSDKETVPGIGGAVDANIYLGEKTMAVNVPAGWQDDGVTLVAQNGHKIVHGFRLAVLSHPNWDPANQPQEEEYGTDRVLLHNASVSGGTRQTFRDGFFWWTQAAGVVWEPYPGLEIKACYDLIASLRAAQVPPFPMPNVLDALTHVQAALTAANVVQTELGKAIPSLKQ